MREGKRKDEVEGGGGDWDGLGPLSYLSSLLPSSLSRQGPYGRKRGKGERNEEKSHTRSPSHSASANPILYCGMPMGVGLTAVGPLAQPPVAYRGLGLWYAYRIKEGKGECWMDNNSLPYAFLSLHSPSLRPLPCPSHSLIRTPQ